MLCHIAEEHDQCHGCLAAMVRCQASNPRCRPFWSQLLSSRAVQNGPLLTFKLTPVCGKGHRRLALHYSQFGYTCQTNSEVGVETKLGQRHNTWHCVLFAGSSTRTSAQCTAAHMLSTPLSTGQATCDQHSQQTADQTNVLLCRRAGSKTVKIWADALLNRINPNATSRANLTELLPALSLHKCFFFCHSSSYWPGNRLCTNQRRKLWLYLSLQA